MARSKERILARSLRKEGKSIKEIAYKLKVSPGSVSAWCKEIELTAEQIKTLQQRIRDPHYGKKNGYLKRVKTETKKRIKYYFNQGKKEVGKLTYRDIFLIGIALYWGEGFKKDHQVGFATSDPRMAKFFIYWLGYCWKIPKESLIIRVTANISYKEKITELEQFWSIFLKIHLSQFSKPFFQQVKWKKQYENEREYHGVVRIKVRRSVNLLRRMYGYIAVR